MKLILLYAVLFTNFVQIHSSKVECTANDEFIKLALTNFTSENITTLEIRAFNSKSQWHLQVGCEKTNQSILKCQRSSMNNSQYFRINTTKSYELLWLYDCYKIHGVKLIKVTKQTWKHFNIKWFYHQGDDQFLKEETLSIRDLTTNKNYSVNIQISSNNLYKFDSGTINTQYRICIKTTYIAPLILFEDAKDVVLTTCQDISFTEVLPNNLGGSSSSLKTTLLVVGIGVVVLFMIFLLFIIYNKKCKAGGDHNFDMNKEESLMADHQVEHDTPDQNLN